MDNRPIGVFDSGLGGLTAVKELLEIMPQEDIVYFGDTGRVPYGSRSQETLIKYAAQDIHFLEEKQVKMIVIACGTISSPCWTPEKAAGPSNHRRPIPYSPRRFACYAQQARRRDRDLHNDPQRFLPPGARGNRPTDPSV